MLCCRLCRTPIASRTGCAGCRDLKEQLVDTEDSAEEKPSLSDVSSESVSAVRAIIRDARGTLAERSLEDVDRLQAQNLVLRAGNTLAKILETARKLQTDGLAAIRNLSFVERAELFVDWYGALPPTYRENVQAAMAKFEASLAAPVPQAVLHE